MSEFKKNHPKLCKAFALAAGAPFVMAGAGFGGKMVENSLASENIQLGIAGLATVIVGFTVANYVHDLIAPPKL